MRSAGRPEPLVPLFEEDPVGPSGALAWNDERRTMESLEGMKERRAVSFLEHVAADLDDVVGPDAHHLRIEGAMVDGAHRHAVRDSGLPALRVLLDVGGVEQLDVPEPAERASRPIRDQHALPERSLMEPCPHDLRRVLTPKRQVRGMGEGLVRLPPLLAHGVVQGDDELVVGRFLADQPHG